MTGRKLAHWVSCSGRPVFGFRGVFTNVSFSQTVEAARQVLADQELALLMASTTDIRQLISGTFGYRLRHAALGSINP